MEASPGVKLVPLRGAKVVPGVSITYATYELLKRSIGVDTGRL